MLAALITGRHELSLTEFAAPVPCDGGVVVDIVLCGICGTDIHAFQSGRPYRPAICGHEWTGIVSGVGDNVDSVREGDRVVVSTAPPCRQCRPCKTGDASHCEVAFLSAIGAGPLTPPHGGFAPQILVAQNRILRAHTTLTDVQLAQVEPTTVTLHAVRRSGLKVGQFVVVQGAGPIGLTTMQCARALGAGHVMVIEPSPGRATLARQLGADSVSAPGEEARTMVRELSGGLNGADLVFECVGKPEAVQWGADLARRGGELCLVGVPKGNAEINPAGWIVKELRVSTAIAYERHEFTDAMDLIADGAVKVDSLHTKTVGLSGLADALADLASGQSIETKVLVNPNL